MNTKTVVISREIQVPDVASTLEASFYYIDETKATNDVLQNEINKLAENNLSLIVSYCASILSDIIKLDDNKIRMLFGPGSFKSRGIRLPDGHEYRITIYRITDYSVAPSKPTVKLSLSEGSGNDFISITVFRNAMTKVDYENWLLNATDFFLHWDTFKTLIDQLINEMIDKVLDKEKEKERKNTELLNVLSNFRI